MNASWLRVATGRWKIECTIKAPLFLEEVGTALDEGLGRAVEQKHRNELDARAVSYVHTQNGPMR